MTKTNILSPQHPALLSNTLLWRRPTRIPSNAVPLDQEAPPRDHTDNTPKPTPTLALRLRKSSTSAAFYGPWQWITAAPEYISQTEHHHVPLRTPILTGVEANLSSKLVAFRPGTSIALRELVYILTTYAYTSIRERRDDLVKECRSFLEHGIQKWADSHQQSQDLTADDAEDVAQWALLGTSVVLPTKHMTCTLRGLTYDGAFVELEDGSILVTKESVLNQTKGFNEIREFYSRMPTEARQKAEHSIIYIVAIVCNKLELEDLDPHNLFERFLPVDCYKKYTQSLALLSSLYYLCSGSTIVCRPLDFEYTAEDNAILLARVLGFETDTSIGRRNAARDIYQGYKKAGVDIKAPDQVFSIFDIGIGQRFRWRCWPSEYLFEARSKELSTLSQASDKYLPLCSVTTPGWVRMSSYTDILLLASAELIVLSAGIRLHIVTHEYYRELRDEIKSKTTANRLAIDLAVMLCLLKAEPSPSKRVTSKICGFIGFHKALARAAPAVEDIDIVREALRSLLYHPEIRLSRASCLLHNFVGVSEGPVVTEFTQYWTYRNGGASHGDVLLQMHAERARQ